MIIHYLNMILIKEVPQVVIFRIKTAIRNNSFRKTIEAIREAFK